jgi:hypothetical protein
VEIWNFCKKYSLPGSTSVKERSREGAATSVRFSEGQVRVDAQGLRSVRILNLDGRTVASWNGDAGEATLSMEGASHGLHVAQIATGTGRTRARFLIP